MTTATDKMTTQQNETFQFVLDVRIYKSITYKQFEKKYPKNARQVWEKMLKEGKKEHCADTWSILEDYGVGIDCDDDGGEFQYLLEETQEKFNEFVEQNEVDDSESEDEDEVECCPNTKPCYKDTCPFRIADAKDKVTS